MEQVQFYPKPLAAELAIEIISNDNDRNMLPATADDESTSNATTYSDD